MKGFDVYIRGLFYLDFISSLSLIISKVVRVFKGLKNAIKEQPTFWAIHATVPFFCVCVFVKGRTMWTGPPLVKTSLINRPIYKASQTVCKTNAFCWGGGKKKLRRVHRIGEGKDGWLGWGANEKKLHLRKRKNKRSYLFTQQKRPKKFELPTSSNAAGDSARIKGRKLSELREKKSKATKKKNRSNNWANGSFNLQRRRLQSGVKNVHRQIVITGFGF